LPRISASITYRSAIRRSASVVSAVGRAACKLRHMRGFYVALPIHDALRRELSWTHYRTL
jgi:hypothetical protein